MKIQIPISKQKPGAALCSPRFWSLRPGVSLDVGAWKLELFLVAFLTLFSFIGSAMAQSEKEKAVDELFADYARPGAPGAVVMVIKNERPFFTKAYGLADLEKKVPCSTNSNFRLASVTKQFTAMAVLILSERGQLSLDDKITKFFPEFPAYGKEITVKQVLTHTSGLIDYEDVMPEGLKIPLSDRDVLHLLCEQDRLYFSPGTEFRYSNSGYALLALLVETVSGQKFAAFLRDHIFQPLGMTNSVAYEPVVSQVPNRAFGHAKNESGDWKFKDQSLTSAVLGDGGVYSSVLDLLKWDQALYAEKIVSRKTLENAFTIHSTKSNYGGSGYGFGWYLRDYRGTKEVWHTGSTCGFWNKISRFPEKKMTVIVLTNRDKSSYAMVDKVIDLFWE